MSDRALIIKEAQKYLARGQIDKAIAEWEKLTKEYPDGNTYNAIGDLYLKKGDRADAIDSFHKSANFFRLEGFSLKALALYKKILNINPADSDALFFLGELNEEKGLITDAIKYYLATADSLSKKGEKERFLDIYDKILALSPTNIHLKNKVAEIYAKEGIMLEAAKQYLQIARLYSDRGETEKSIGYCQKVLDVQPLNREAILGINRIYEMTGNLEKAIEHIKEAINLFPQDTDIHLRYAEIHIMTGRFDEAREYLKKVIEIEPANIKARKLLGDIYINEGDREKAWTEYIPALDEIMLDEKYDDAIKLLAFFKDIDPLETGKRLVSIYRHLGEQGQIANELNSLGDVFFAKGMQKEALNCYKEALSITPDDGSLNAKVAELEKEVSPEIGVEYISIEDEKAVDEAIVEADISIVTPPEWTSIEDYKEEIAEADFYSRQGLTAEAREILERLQNLFPENKEIRQKLDSLDQVSEGEQEIEYAEENQKESSVTEGEILEAEVTQEHEPSLDSDVMDVFNEFKKGVEKEFGEEDHETHYNLGIAYKEMGLTDDAIREFQLSINNPKQFVPSSSMLGICYMEKGIYSLAIDVLKNAVEKMEDRGESYWAMKYDLAHAYENKGNLKEALDLYTNVYGWNSKFRSVSDKINHLRTKVIEDISEQEKKENRKKNKKEQKKTKDRKNRISYL